MPEKFLFQARDFNCCAHLPFGAAYAHRKPFAAFSAPCSKHPSAVWRAHSFAETVLVSPLSIGWLECPFHFKYLLA